MKKKNVQDQKVIHVQNQENVHDQDLKYKVKNVNVLDHAAEIENADVPDLMVIQKDVLQDQENEEDLDLDPAAIVMVRSRRVGTRIDSTFRQKVV